MLGGRLGHECKGPKEAHMHFVGPSGDQDSTSWVRVKALGCIRKKPVGPLHTASLA